MYWRWWLACAMLAAGIAVSGVGMALALDTAAVEVRIAALRHDDGRVEFALQQRVDGEWGERILPTRRFYPVDANRWLYSSPLTVDVELPAPEPTATPTASATPATAATPAPERTPTPLSSSWFELSTGTYVSPLTGDPSIFLGCLSLNLGERVLPSVSIHYDSISSLSTRSVSYRVDGGSVVTESWSNSYVSGGTSAVWPSAQFIEELRYASMITIQIGIVTTTLDVGGAGTIMDRLGCFE